MRKMSAYAATAALNSKRKGDAVQALLRGRPGRVGCDLADFAASAGVRRTPRAALPAHGPAPAHRVPCSARPAVSYLLVVVAVILFARTHCLRVCCSRVRVSQREHVRGTAAIPEIVSFRYERFENGRSFLGARFSALPSWLCSDEDRPRFPGHRGRHARAVRGRPRGVCRLVAPRGRRRLPGDALAYVEGGHGREPFHQTGAAWSLARAAELQRSAAGEC